MIEKYVFSNLGISGNFEAVNYLTVCRIIKTEWKRSFDEIKYFFQLLIIFMFSGFIKKSTP
jgi:hypothetical protein